MSSRPYTENEEEEPDPPKTFWQRFTQQRLRAWQCVLAPKWVIAIYIVCGICFSALGVVLLLISWSVVEYVHDYTDETPANASRVGVFTIEIDRDMEPPIWVYYSLDRFHQNHRRYIKSRASEQLKEVERPELREENLDTCRPWVVQGGGQGFESKRVNYPCGLIARSVFNDTYDIRVSGSDDTWRDLSVDSSAKSIAWAADTAGKFQNVDPEAASDVGGPYQVRLNMWINQLFPPAECRQIEISDKYPFVPVTVGMRQEMAPGTTGASANPETVDVVDCKGYMNSKKGSQEPPSCNFKRQGENFTCEGNYKVVQVQDWGIESGHFIVWMRIAGLPSFRKLWGRIDEPLKAGSKLRVHYVNNFPVKEFYGRKAFVISTATMLGGRNDFLGYGYLTVGACCLLFGVAYFWRHLVQPRSLGDISLLSHCQ